MEIQSCQWPLKAQQSDNSTSKDTTPRSMKIDSAFPPPVHEHLDRHYQLQIQPKPAQKQIKHTFTKKKYVCLIDLSFDLKLNNSIILNSFSETPSMSWFGVVEILWLPTDLPLLKESGIMLNKANISLNHHMYI